MQKSNVYTFHSLVPVTVSNTWADFVWARTKTLIGFRIFSTICDPMMTKYLLKQYDIISF